MKRYIFPLILFFCFTFASVDAHSDDGIPPYSARLIKITSDEDLDSLTNQGVEILHRRGDILLCFIPNPQTRGNSVATRPRPISPTLDIAKNYYEAASIQNGSATGTPFTGKGIVVGICDIGIDPLHPTFLDADGLSRIKRVVHYKESEGIRHQLEGDNEYREWVTDDPENYHATHVCGILAGNGAGTPFSGTATDAEIVVTVSELTEVGLLAGVEDIIEYAKEVGKPAVINISVGSYTGAHDGSSLFSQYLDMCAEDAIIVMSSGNEGVHLNSLTHTFTEDSKNVSFRIGNTKWDNYEMYGATEIWSGSGSPLSISFGLYDSNIKSIVRWEEPITLTEGTPLEYILDNTTATDVGLPFEGEIIIEGEVNAENRRHCITLIYDFSSKEQSSNGVWARYELAVKVAGNPGNDVEVYADGIYSRLVGTYGSTQPTTDRSISDLACGFNIISVGMYGNRDSIPYSAPAEFMDDEIYFLPTDYESGATVQYSSYGTLRDGRTLPLTVAPGATLMSAGSRPFFDLYPYHPHLRMNGSLWVSEGGTSMSSPYVAGYIATWLEAVPSLTVKDIQKILANTNRFDIAEPENPRNASGYFDPVQGLLQALKAGGVESSWDDLEPADHVEVYDITGIKRYAGAADGLSGIEKGLYLVKSRKGVRKIILKGRH